MTRKNTYRMAAAASLLALVGVVGCSSGEDKPASSRPAPKSNTGGDSNKGTGGSTAANKEPTGWGASLTGTFVYQGDAPTLAPIVPTKDAEFCGNHELVDETLIVNPANKGIANIVVFVRTAKAPVAESYGEMKGQQVTLANKNCRFEPHVLPVWLEQTMVVTNEDPVAHNTNLASLGDKEGSFNEMLTQGGDKSVTFSKSQNNGQPAACNIHPWMKGYVLPRDNPYFAVTDQDGKFTIKDLPAGVELEFQVWQEKAGNLPAKAEWSSGRFKLTFEADAPTDLGTIEIVPSLFAK